MALKASTKDVAVWEHCKYFTKANAVEIKVALASCRFDGGMPNHCVGDTGLGVSIIPASQAVIW